MCDEWEVEGGEEGAGEGEGFYNNGVSEGV